MQRCNANKLFQRNWRAASFSTCRQENMAVFTDAINKPGVFWNNFLSGASFCEWGGSFAPIEHH